MFIWLDFFIKLVGFLCLWWSLVWLGFWCFLLLLFVLFCILLGVCLFLFIVVLYFDYDASFLQMQFSNSTVSLKVGLSSSLIEVSWFWASIAYESYLCDHWASTQEVLESDPQSSSNRIAKSNGTTYEMLLLIHLHEWNVLGVTYFCIFTCRTGTLLSPSVGLHQK